MKTISEPEYIVCSKCGSDGGTLVKIGENEYQHQSPKMCKKEKE